MSESHNLIDCETRSYRFSGYKLPRNSDNCIVVPVRHIYQPEYWKTRAITLPEGSQPYDSLRKNNK